MKIREKKSVFKGFYELFSVKLEEEYSGKIIDREQFNLFDSVAALVWDTQLQKVILVKQFRVGAEKALIEIPAGKRDVEGESASTTAIREIEEEIGYQTDSIKEIANFFTTPGPVTERMTLFYAEVSYQSGSGGGVKDEHENIELIKMDATTFLQTTFEDAKTIIAQQWFQIHHQN